MWAHILVEGLPLGAKSLRWEKWVLGPPFWFLEGLESQVRTELSKVGEH